MAYTPTTDLIFGSAYANTANLVFGESPADYPGRALSANASVTATFSPTATGTLTLAPPNYVLSLAASLPALATSTASGILAFAPPSRSLSLDASIAPTLAPSAAGTLTFSQSSNTLNLNASVTPAFNPSASGTLEFVGSVPWLTPPYIPDGNLVFWDPNCGSGDLVFGNGTVWQCSLDLVAPDAATFSPVASGALTFGPQLFLDAIVTLPDPQASGTLGYTPPIGMVLNASVSVDLQVTGSGLLRYNSNVWRGLYVSTKARYTDKQQIQPTRALPWQNGIAIAKSHSELSGSSLAVGESKRLAAVASSSLVVANITARQSPPHVSQRTRTMPWGKLLAIATEQRTTTVAALPVTRAIQMPYLHLKAVPRHYTQRWVGQGPVARRLALPYARAAIVASEFGVIYTLGNTPSPGIRFNVQAPYVPAGGKAQYNPTDNLVFRCPILPNGELRFCKPQCQLFTVPSQGVYVVTNSFSLVRVDNGNPLYAISFDLTAGADSWTWTWSAKVGGKQLVDVLSNDPLSPIEVLATINGTAFKLIVETIARDRAFNSDVISLSGRGISAYLSAPYAPISAVFSSSAITALQAANLALEFNGVSIGWDIEWGINDWLIAGNAFSSTGTYIEHLQRIAEAGGGYLQPTHTTSSVRILPYYPTSPWDWASATPDLILPEDIFITESIAYTSKTAYTGVYVNGGSSGGRLDLIKIAGTDGSLLAPTIVDPLATDPIMTRQRGMRVLGDTGRETKITLRLPVLPQTGIILPGTMLRYIVCGATKMGIVRSTAVSYTLPVVSQNIEIESHEYL